MLKFSPRFQHIALPFVAAAFHLYYGYRVIGRENIPEGGCVVCPNHTNVSDPPLAAAALTNRHSICIMAKVELFSIRFLGPLITVLGAFPVDRGKADITAIKVALKSVKEGRKLLIFPQGTRRAGEDDAKEGAAMLAVKSRAPVLPVYITENTGFRCKKTIVIGKPFYPESNGKDYAAVATDILHRIYALRAEVK